MKRFYAVLVACVMFWFLAVPAFGEQKTPLPSIVVKVAHNLDFFARPWVMWGYEDCFLYDVNRLDNERIGVVLISPAGFEVRLVYDVHTLDVIYLDMLVPRKSKREAMRSESVSVTDAVKLAKCVVSFAKETK